MGYQAIFKRYEIKYFLTRSQQKQLLKAMQPYMKLDQYGHTTIRNLYFDTDSYQLIRRSLEKPVYKEKLRVRSYGKAAPGKPVYVELKKKYKSVVYKGGWLCREWEALGWLCGDWCHPRMSQIVEEIDYFRDFYRTLHPVCFLSYERDAYYALDGSDFRVTFDTNIISREQELSLETEAWGTRLLPPDRVLMELKTSGGLPLWMTDFLTKNKIYKTSFSKYGEAYRREIAEIHKGGRLYA